MLLPCITEITISKIFLINHIFPGFLPQIVINCHLCQLSVYHLWIPSCFALWYRSWTMQTFPRCQLVQRWALSAGGIEGTLLEERLLFSGSNVTPRGTHEPTGFASTMQSLTSTSEDFPVSFTNIPEGWYPTGFTGAPTGGFQPVLVDGISANSLSLSRPQPHPLQQRLDVSVGLLPSLFLRWVLVSAGEVVAAPPLYLLFLYSVKFTLLLSCNPLILDNY